MIFCMCTVHGFLPPFHASEKTKLQLPSAPKLGEALLIAVIKFC